ncbi:MAG: ankyrin repeat domain-containing protein [Legionella sp.]|uniref:ankyrin repeat domain-containing protein n=1 Tax=Legionella sp. TaxID=459 RepID=UPI0039E25723
MPLLFYAAKNNFLELANFLILEKVSLEDTFSYHYMAYANEFSPDLDDATALDAACYYNHPQMVQLLLRNNANYLHPNTNSCALGSLFLTNTVEICRILLNKAEEDNKIAELLSLKNYKKISVYSWHCYPQNIEILKELMQIKNYHQYINIDDVLRHARIVSWKYPDYSEAFNQICIQLRTLKSENANTNNTASIVSNGYYFLFNTQQKKWQDKEELVKRIITKIYELFSSPEQCNGHGLHRRE